MGTQTMTETNEHGYISKDWGRDQHDYAIEVGVRRACYGNGSRIGVAFHAGATSIVARMTDGEAMAMAQAIIAAVNGGHEDCVSFPPRD